MPNRTRKGWLSLYGTSGNFIPRYRRWMMPKKSGGVRTIYQPSAKTMMFLKGLSDRLTKFYLSHPWGSKTLDCVHGFLPGRSPVTNAWMHMGYRFSLSVDLEDFFEQCTRTRLENRVGSRTLPAAAFLGLREESLAMCFPSGSAAQGLPTSPIISNIMFWACDYSINGTLRDEIKDVAYTRYADDLTVSVNTVAELSKANLLLHEQLHLHGWSVNARKTHGQDAANGRRIICGVAIDKDGLYPTRKTKRRLRAARHQGNTDQVRGYEEWCLLKTPLEFRDLELEKAKIYERFLNEEK